MSTRVRWCCVRCDVVCWCYVCGKVWVLCCGAVVVWCGVVCVCAVLCCVALCCVLLCCGAVVLCCVVLCCGVVWCVGVVWVYCITLWISLHIADIMIHTRLPALAFMDRAN